MKVHILIRAQVKEINEKGIYKFIEGRIFNLIQVMQIDKNDIYT